MDPETAARYELRARIIKALAHPTRLFIVDRLSQGEQCVCELTAQIGADISTVSKHLSLLKAADVVSDEKRGTQVFYTLRMPCVLTFLECVEEMCHTVAQEHLELARTPTLRAADKGKPACPTR